ncbi:2-desacetyl-2-hydroxyethyl bacteriochlorophyllide A dehydrogenase [Skermanella stibiiresistens SB22]|uniref:2-desacetyl-2-hydroxyethyl bacteriochlorophyllide A dehydrogenase n=1 Tax=Skermanella stibiiresistens SB22 TaxID=1385369 RepID=W9H002_9PROT|nr:chlorophyll synthesis pathway protein BchC [Skermanella stibiiresistens]EWY39515.1 2-desacetyl-2-hydroxyethyl bacteriochlorophyllide A dehydrogenase [Skermanella stibiiresistens SB22]
METLAVVIDEPERLALRTLDLTPPEAGDVVVETLWSGISTGTERLLWLGQMPAFPGLGYPLVPGYETVGRVIAAGATSGRREGDFVFVPGARCFGAVRGLFGGAAAQLVVAGDRVLLVDEGLGEQAVLLALAATAHHVLDVGGTPDLIVGHGVLGRLLARLALAKGAAAPTVWERHPLRSDAGAGYAVIHPDADPRRDYRAIFDASGDAGLLDTLIGRLARGGEITLAGFYSQPLSFTFPPAFMREARIRVAAEWTPDDLPAVRRLIEGGRLSLDGLITHRLDVAQADDAYRTAFGDPACLKMILDWRRRS